LPFFPWSSLWLWGQDHRRKVWGSFIGKNGYTQAEGLIGDSSNFFVWLDIITIFKIFLNRKGIIMKTRMKVLIFANLLFFLPVCSFTAYVSAQPTSITFADKGTVSTGDFRVAGVTVTPEVNLPLLNLVQWNGLGVVGGTLDSVIDAGESVLFAFDGAATGVSYFVQFAQESDGDGKFGETDVEGYGADGSWLGTVVLNGVGPLDVSAAFGGQALRAFRLRPSERIRVYQVNFTQMQPPETPVGLTWRSKFYKVQLSWQAAERATSYSVYRKLNSETVFTLRGKTQYTTLVDILPSGTISAGYYVVGENTDGYSPPSATVTATPTFR
jgi:hypothetical protein